MAECRMHALPYVQLRGESWQRCRQCGHRMANGHRRPRQARYRWPWWWLIEPVNRHRAKRAKWINVIRTTRKIPPGDYWIAPEDWE